MNIKSFQCDVPSFRIKALSWASQFSCCTYLNNNKFSNKIPAFIEVLAADAREIFTPQSAHIFEDFHTWYEKQCRAKNWTFGYFTYDLKNKIEDLQSRNPDGLNFPEIYFYIPKHLIFFKDNEVTIRSENPKDIFNAIQQFDHSTIQSFDHSIIHPAAIKLKQRLSREKYLGIIQKLKCHIVEGDIYEINYCMEFFAENVSMNPLLIYQKLNQLSPMPFSAFHRNDRNYLMSASPERFLKKEGTKLIAQPIKGTAARGKDEREDIQIKEALTNSKKERAENVMIVDLTRNDLSRSCVPGTVKVDELFSVVTFSQVHQMISTVSGTLESNVHFINAIKNAFPMGSMTGAPKIRAMQLIEEFELSKRGLFSGSIGYINPEGDFDFNVVIRSILYNAEKEYLSFHVGSAITAQADPAQEYEECLLKASAMIQVLEKMK